MQDRQNAVTSSYRRIFEVSEQNRCLISVENFVMSKKHTMKALLRAKAGWANRRVVTGAIYWTLT